MKELMDFGWSTFTQKQFIFSMIIVIILKKRLFTYLFHDGGSYHIETSPLIRSPNQWTSVYMAGRELRHERVKDTLCGI